LPTQRRHLQQAEHNEALFSQLEVFSPQFLDWQVTTLFYAALHYVDAYLATAPPTGVHPDTHRDRLHLVETERNLRPIARDYRLLMTQSVQARYEAVRFTASEVASFRAEEFARIRSRIRALLGLSV
jgi:hypothetical protein